MRPRTSAIARTSPYSSASCIDERKNQCSRWASPSAANPANSAQLLVSGLGLYKVLRDVVHKGHSSSRHRHSAAENFAKVLGSAVIKLRIFLVLAHAGAIEVDAREQAFGARVAQQL